MYICKSKDDIEFVELSKTAKQNNTNRESQRIQTKTYLDSLFLDRVAPASARRPHQVLFLLPDVIMA